MPDFEDKFKPSKSDKALWDAYVSDIKSAHDGQDMHEDDFASLLDGEGQSDENELSPSDDNLKASEEVGLDEKEPLLPQKISSSQPYQLDRRTDDRLRKGKIPIEERLDLHGLNKAQAHEKLQRFLSVCHARSLRCVLVITGKGTATKTSDNWLSPSKGVLKENVPIWLEENPLKYIVLKYYKAQAKDGGSGALYVYLKRNKKD